MVLKQITKWFIIFLLFIFANLPAHADFHVCNSTQRAVGVSIGYPILSGWISEGWWQIEPTNCKKLIEGNLSSRFYYLYAEDEHGTWHWDGAIPMCIGENPFKIFDVKNCFARGFQKVGFQEIDTENQVSWMVQLTDSENNTAFSDDHPTTGIKP